MQALLFILNALFTLIVIAFLLRVLMPLVRADFRNPFGEAVLKVTNPLVLPLRKFMPPGKRIDPSSVVALLIVQFAGTALLRAVAGGGFGLEADPAAVASMACCRPCCSSTSSRSCCMRCSAGSPAQPTTRLRRS